MVALTSSSSWLLCCCLALYCLPTGQLLVADGATTAAGVTALLTTAQTAIPATAPAIIEGPITTRISPTSTQTISKAAPTTLTAAPASSTAAPASSTAAPASSTAAPISSTAAPISSTAAPISSTAAPTSSTAAPTSSTAAPTSPTAAPTVLTAAPITSAEIPTSSTAAPTTSTAAPTTSTAAPTTSTAAPTTSTAAPTTSTAAPTTSTAAPTTSTAAPTTLAAVPISPTATLATSTAAPISSTATLTTSTAAPISSTATLTTSTAAPISSTATLTTSTATLTTSTATLTTSTAAPATTVQQTTTALQSAAARPLTQFCHFKLHSNLFDCSDVDGRERSFSKSDYSKLDLRLPLGRSRSLCCRDPNKTVRHPDGAGRGHRVRLNCSLATMGRGQELEADRLHCSDTCNTTLRLSSNRGYYSLFLPLHSVPPVCQWQLLGVSQVSISANSNLKRAFPKPFLCLSREPTTSAGCFSSAPPRSPGLDSRVSVYPLSPQPPQVANLTCGGACYLHYSWLAARNRLSFRSFKIELIKLQGAPGQASEPTEQLSATTIRALSPAPPPFEFRVTRGVLAGVLASAIILLSVAFCIWGYRSWQYRMYSSPLRRLVGRTPLHRLPAYSSRMFDLERLQLDCPRSRKASSATTTLAAVTAASAMSAGEAEEVEELEMVDDGVAVVNRAFRL